MSKQDPKPKPKVVREQAAVYLDSRDRALLEDLAERTGLARTELFRRGLRRLAEDLSPETKSGSSLDYLVATARDDGFPTNVAERHDEYLQTGYAKSVKSKRARPR